MVLAQNNSTVFKNQGSKLSEFIGKAVLLGALMGNTYSCGARTDLGITYNNSVDAGIVDAGAEDSPEDSVLDSGITDASLDSAIPLTTCTQDAGSFSGYSVFADFQAGLSPFHFNTDMLFNNTFTVSLVSGSLVSGNPSDIHDGDSICLGSMVKVTPSVTAKWNVSQLDILSMYPLCENGSYCPQMIDDNNCVNSRPITWLSPSVFSSHKNFGDMNDFSGEPNMYVNLGQSSFFTEPVTYEQVLGLFFNHKEGGAAVFCKGDIEFLQNGVVNGSSPMAALQPANMATSSSGAQYISTRISGADCFASLVKHPLDISTFPNYFFLFYFTHNSPMIPPSLEEHTISVNVVNCP